MMDNSLKTLKNILPTSSVLPFDPLGGMSSSSATATAGGASLGLGPVTTGSLVTGGSSSTPLGLLMVGLVVLVGIWFLVKK